MENKITTKTILTHPVHLLAFGFGSGLAPKAPGTFGTLIAIPLFLMIAHLPTAIYALICGLVIVGGVFICGYSAKALKVHDHPGIVWDEIAGFLITLFGFAASWQNILLGFILFRFFDIVKPWPIRWADRQVTGGLGIMLDDVIAGLFAWAGLYGVNYLWF